MKKPPSLLRLHQAIDHIHTAEKMTHATSERVQSFRDSFIDGHTNDPEPRRAEEAMNKMQDAISHLEKASSALEDIEL